MQDVLRKTAENLRKVASELPDEAPPTGSTKLDSRHLLNLFKFASRNTR